MKLKLLLASYAILLGCTENVGATCPADFGLRDSPTVYAQLSKKGTFGEYKLLESSYLGSLSKEDAKRYITKKESFASHTLPGAPKPGKIVKNSNDDTTNNICYYRYTPSDKSSLPTGGTAAVKTGTLVDAGKCPQGRVCFALKKRTDIKSLGIVGSEEKKKWVKRGGA